MLQSSETFVQGSWSIQSLDVGLNYGMRVKIVHNETQTKPGNENKNKERRGELRLNLI